MLKVLLMGIFFKTIYHALARTTGPLGGIRPRRIYDILARRAFHHPEYEVFTNRWGDELLLSHFYHIDRNILIFGTYDLDLHLGLQRLLKPGMVAFDVGANLGEMALHMARLVGSGGQVWAFEPVPAIHQRLLGHIQRNNVGNIIHAVDLALSDQTGAAALAAPDEHADNQGLGSIANLTAKAGPVRTTIPTITLDDFVAQHGISRIDLMKIDIQGAEPKLIAGGTQTLSRFAPDLLMEFSPDDLRHTGTTSRDLAVQLSELGYQIHALIKEGIGPAIEIQSLPLDFAATNVLCRKRR
jgi:FkbM family methyltransferase